MCEFSDAIEDKGPIVYSGFAPVDGAMFCWFWIFLSLLYPNTSIFTDGVAAVAVNSCFEATVNLIYSDIVSGVTSKFTTGLEVTYN